MLNVYEALEVINGESAEGVEVNYYYEYKDYFRFVYKDDTAVRSLGQLNYCVVKQTGEVFYRPLQGERILKRSLVNDVYISEGSISCY